MLKMENSVRTALLAHARRELPNEACGYLGGKAGRVSVALPLRNLDASPEHFSMDPQEQFEAVRSLRSQGLQALGVYHSHPDSPARLSEEDLRLLRQPGLAYVVVSLQGGQESIKAYETKDGQALALQAVFEGQPE
jgi:proteasome lid subunit RPN8/RPN11